MISAPTYIGLPSRNRGISRWDYALTMNDEPQQKNRQRTGLRWVARLAEQLKRRLKHLPNSQTNRPLAGNGFCPNADRLQTNRICEA